MEPPAGARRRDRPRRFKSARWALLKRPDDLTDRQADTPRAVWRLPAQGTLRVLFAEDLRHSDVSSLLDRWFS